MKRGLWLLALASLGCSGEGNTGQPNRNFTWCVDATGTAIDCSERKGEVAATLDLWDQVPWANYATPQIADDNKIKVSSKPIYPPISHNAEDPGSAPVDCGGLDAIDLSPSYLDDFEPFDQTKVGMAGAWSGYDDGSDTSFRVPGDVDWYPGLALQYDRAAYGMPSDRHDAHPGARPDCGGVHNDWMLHYRGGRFNYYGGGMAHPFAAEQFTSTVDAAGNRQPGVLKTGCPDGSDLCPAAGTDGTPNYNIFGVDPGVFKQVHQFYDVSKYDGLVFWARRGPDSATGLLVGLQDKYTSDDLARQNEKFCKRLKVCVPGCVNGYQCIINEKVTDPMTEEYQLHRCMPPDYNVATNVPNPALREFLFPRCEADTCKPPAFYSDPDFDGTTCNAFAFTGNDEGYWCSSPDKPVAPWAERCGDAFVAAISLSTDWKLYKLPFDSFRQVGFGKPAPSFDLKTLYSIAFQFTVGYTDVYVDDVSFYRNK
jgi:hypothetical protein